MQLVGGVLHALLFYKGMEAVAVKPANGVLQLRLRYVEGFGHVADAQVRVAEAFVQVGDNLPVAAAGGVRFQHLPVQLLVHGHGRVHQRLQRILPVHARRVLGQHGLR